MARRIPPLAWYAVATAIQAGASLLAIPLLTRTLGPDEFGRFALWESLPVLFAQMCIAGCNHGLLKLVGEDQWEPTEAWRKLIPAVTMFLVFGACLVGVAGHVLYPQGYFFQFALLSMLEGINLMGLATARAANRSVLFARILGVRAAAYLGLLLLASRFHIPSITSAQALLWWQILPVGAASLVGSVPLLATVRFNRDSSRAAASWQPTRIAMTYGLPLMGAGLLAALIAVGDRYVLNHWVSHVVLGGYVVMVKISSAVGLLAMPLNMWFPAARFQHMKDADGGHAFFRRCALFALLAFGGCGSLLWAAAPGLIAWFNPHQVADDLVVALLVTAAVSTGMVAVMNVGLLRSGQTHWSFWSTLLGGATQLLLLFLLIPFFGPPGAAAATCAASLGSLAGQHALSQMKQRIPFAYLPMLVVTGGLLLSCLAIEMLGLTFVSRVTFEASTVLLLCLFVWRICSPGFLIVPNVVMKGKDA